jgi:hypothetical protein
VVAATAVRRGDANSSARARDDESLDRASGVHSDDGTKMSLLAIARCDRAAGSTRDVSSDGDMLWPRVDGTGDDERARRPGSNDARVGEGERPRGGGDGDRDGDGGSTDGDSGVSERRNCGEATRCTSATHSGAGVRETQLRWL